MSRPKIPQAYAPTLNARTEHVIRQNQSNGGFAEDLERVISRLRLKNGEAIPLDSWRSCRDLRIWAPESSRRVRMRAERLAASE